MRGWRNKFIFTLMVFFAGFATAIYTLAPAPEDEIAARSDKDTPQANFNSEEFVEGFNTGMHKCLELGKEAAVRTGKLVKEKIKGLRDA